MSSLMMLGRSDVRRVAPAVERPAGRHGHEVTARVRAEQGQPALGRIVYRDEDPLALGHDLVFHVEDVEVPADDGLLPIRDNAGAHGSSFRLRLR